MARARNIKPGFFKNEVLGVEDPLISLLFISLWCLADKEGKLEDRPLRIKAETFPYRENIDINGYLTVLVQHGFIRRYSADGVAVIQVIKFKEHQSPHNTEKASTLPDYISEDVENKQRNVITVNSPLSFREETEAKRPDSLIPDSLIPDSLITDNSIDTNVSIVVNGETIPDCPHQEIISLYKKNIPMGIQPKAWDGARAVALKSRWRERKERQDLAWWDKFFDYVSQSKFLTGQVVAKDRKPFEITLPWLLKPENFNKIIEGFYHR